MIIQQNNTLAEGAAERSKAPRLVCREPTDLDWGYVSL